MNSARLVDRSSIARCLACALLSLATCAQWGCADEAVDRRPERPGSRMHDDAAPDSELSRPRALRSQQQRELASRRASSGGAAAPDPSEPGTSGEAAPAPAEPADDTAGSLPVLPSDTADLAARTSTSAAFVSVPNLAIAGQCSGETLRGGAQQALQRLTRTELLRLVQLLFPSLFYYSKYPSTYYSPNFDLMAEYPRDVAEDPNENFNSLHSEAQVAAWMDTSDYFAGAVAGSQAERDRYGGACMRQEVIDAECWNGFVTKLGRAVFRRPLAADELAALVSDLPQDDVPAAIQRLVAQLLRSPNAVFHVFAGTADAAVRVRLTDHEVAERLAFGLTGAPPDEPLALAADNGELTTLAQVQAHAVRLLSGPLARQRVREIIGEWVRLDRITRPPDTLALSDWPLNTLHLDRYYLDEINAFIDYVIWTKRGSFADLMTLPVAFPVERKVADVYGVQVWTKGMPASAPDHPGLLLRAGLLASGRDTTNPIVRGVTVLRRALCDDLPPPNPTIVATRLIELNKLDPREIASHDIVSQITSPASCMACHNLINPMGFLLESFDALGSRRTEQRIIERNKQGFARQVATFPLPGPQLLRIGELPPASYDDPNQLMAAVAQSKQAQACAAVRLFRGLHYRPEQPADACAIAEALDALSQGRELIEVISRLVANEDIFWRKGRAD